METQIIVIIVVLTLLILAVVGSYIYDFAILPNVIVGKTGPQGLQGIQGKTGSQGIQGIQGIQGMTGPQGIQGMTGLQGIQGMTGMTGIQGIQGIQGNIGITGPQGIQGIQGMQGIQGNTGMIGPQGNAGIPGPQGNAGIPGPQGNAGIPGPQGNAGIPGPQGQQGIQGNMGSQGNSGQGYTIQTTSLFSNAKGPLPLTGNFSTSGGQLEIFASGSAYGTASGLIGVNILLDGTIIGTMQLDTNVVNQHETLISNRIVLSGIMSGKHSLQLTPFSPVQISAGTPAVIGFLGIGSSPAVPPVVLSTVTDANDFFNVSIIEYVTIPSTVVSTTAPPIPTTAPPIPTTAPPIPISTASGSAIATQSGGVSSSGSSQATQSGGVTVTQSGGVSSSGSAIATQSAGVSSSGSSQATQSGGVTVTQSGGVLSSAGVLSSGSSQATQSGGVTVTQSGGGVSASTAYIFTITPGNSAAALPSAIALQLTSTQIALLPNLTINQISQITGYTITQIGQALAPYINWSCNNGVAGVGGFSGSCTSSGVNITSSSPITLSQISQTCGLTVNTLAYILKITQPQMSSIGENFQQGKYSRMYHAMYAGVY